METRKNSRQPRKTLPPIPDKRLFTIGEVSYLCDVKPHVLRYWEQEFPQLSPSKRQGNRRCYQHKEVLLVRKIRSLLYEQGFTINGARAQLSVGKQQAKQHSFSQFQPQNPVPLPLFVGQSSQQGNSSGFLRSSIAALISDAQSVMALLENKKVLEEEAYF